MTDLKKVIRGLECCTAMIKRCCPCPTECPYYEKCMAEISHLFFDVMHDALELLKAQEPVKAVADGEDSYMCNNCGTVIGWVEWESGGIEEVKYKFCPECGRAVKWE